VAMMILRPEGLWPEAKQRQELHKEESTESEIESGSGSESSG
jgi:hypothetical protein